MKFPAPVQRVDLRPWPVSVDLCLVHRYKQPRLSLLGQLVVVLHMQRACGCPSHKLGEGADVVTGSLGSGEGLRDEAGFPIGLTFSML